MTLDASAYCPGGSGKKIKHCACRDISGELDKIMRSLEGNQRVAALDRINRVLATKANRPCLLTLKILTLLDMKDMQSLEQTITTFVQVAPDNALAHTFAALLEVRKNHPKAAVTSLQAAICRATDSFPGELYDAIGAVAQVLAADNQYLAARGHLLFRAMIGGQEENAVEPLIEISAARRVPPLLKRDLIFASCPEDVPWRNRFEAASNDCVRGAWSQGLESFKALDQEYPGQAEILKNIATAQSYLGLNGSAEAWHTYATLESLDFDEAVTAEATHQLLDYEASRKTVGLVKLTLNVTDASALQEKLLSARQVTGSPRDPAEPRQDDAPPPKAIFHLLDRPALSGDEELSLERLPRIMAQLLLYGKETDREARVELLLAKGEQYDASRKLVSDVAGDLLISDGEEEEVLDAVPRDDVELFPTLRFPDETSLSERKRWATAAIAAAFHEKWPTLPLAVLDNKTPREASADPAYRLPLAAALLVLEQNAEVESWPIDVDQLRDQLGVPVPATIDPASDKFTALEPQDWRRVDAEKLTDPQLVNLYQLAALYNARAAILRLAPEVLRRDNLADQIDLAAVAGGLAQLAEDSDEAVELFGRARTLAAKAGTSPARWYIAELPLRLMRGEAAEVQNIMTVLQTQHIREPGVSEALYNILVRFGIITPDGRMAGDSAPAAPPAAAAEPSIWTPDGTPSPAGQPKESKIWIPGMD